MAALLIISIGLVCVSLVEYQRQSEEEQVRPDRTGDRQLNYTRARARTSEQAFN